MSRRRGSFVSDCCCLLVQNTDHTEKATPYRLLIQRAGTMAGPKRVILCKKKKQELTKQKQQQQGPVEHSPSSPFITLRISPEKYQEKFASSEGRLLPMADHAQGAFQGTRSKDPTPA